MPKVTIIIPCWNSLKHFKKNLPSVAKAAKNKKNNIQQIIIVDDASPDGSVKFVQNHYPEIRIIRNSKNRGFAATVNIGVRNATGDLIVLLNADVTPSPNFLIKVLPLFRSKKVFGVSLAEEGYSWAKASFVNGYFQHSPGNQTSETHPTTWVSGGSGVFKKSIWRSLGGLDEDLFTPFYWEDVDISYRALKRGYSLFWEPNAKVLHNHESVINTHYFSATKLSLIKERNELLFLWKNITNPILFRKHLKGLLSRTYHHPGYFKVILFAATRIIPVIKSRKIEESQEKVSDITIFSKFENA